MTNTVSQNSDALLEKMRRKAEGRVTAKWQTAADVDWEDLEHFIGNCQRRGDKDSFNTALRVLEALKKQVLER